MAPKRKNRAQDQKQHAPRIVDHVSDSEDEEIPEDEAFNSDDERKYGAFFQNDSDGSDEVSSSDDDGTDGIASEDDEEEDGDGGKYMLDLLNQLDGPKGGEGKSHDGTMQMASQVAESEFAASVVKNSHLTMDALMQGLQDTQAFGRMQQTMSKVVNSQAPAIPVARPVADRAQRKVHYEHETEQVSRWMEAVQQNRKAETLDFRHKERLGDVTKEQLVAKFVPTTDFEKELHEALDSAGQQDEEAILRREEAILQGDDLGANSLTLEEYKKRRGQLAKLRALMFYHEQKRHHMNKIKSKKYRRIRKRQKQRQKDAEESAEMEENPDLLNELEEKEEVERMKERMTLAHKNTSKWAKRILKRGKNVDADTRRALSAQLKQGDDLRKKMQFSKDDGESSDEQEGDELAKTARNVLEDADDGSEHPKRNMGLFKLSFMQKGIEEQRQKAKEEARQLLRELQSDDGESNSDNEIQTEEDPLETSISTRRVAAADEMKKVIAEGSLLAKALEVGNSDSVALASGIDIDLPVQDEVPTTRFAQRNFVSRHNSTPEVEVHEVGRPMPSHARTESAPHSNTENVASLKRVRSDDDDDNPWMIPDDNVQEMPTAIDAKQNPRVKRTMLSSVLDVDSVVDGIPIANTRQHSDLSTKQSSATQIAELSQEELVRRAFVTTNEKEIVKDFAAEKKEAEGLDDPTRKKSFHTNASASGWGSWAGEGTPAPKPRKLPKRLQPPTKKIPKRKRQDERKPNVIINEKRQKKTANQFQISDIPYPYSSREEYERVMAGGVGREWNVSSGVKSLTRPAIMTRAGKIIQPISRKVKQKRPAAKF